MAKHTEAGKQKPNAKALPESPKGSNGLEQTLWLAADKMRKNIDAAEYKHIALGLIFLKYISDSFESLHNKLIEGKGDYKGADPDEYRSENIFFALSKPQWLSLRNDLTENIIYCIISTVFLIFKRKKTEWIRG